MRSRNSSKILNGHPHSIIGKTLLLAVVFCLVLSGTRSFSIKASSVDYFSFSVYDADNISDSYLCDINYYDAIFDTSSYNMAQALQTSIDNVASWITDIYPNFSWITSSSSSLLSFNSAIYSYLENIDPADPEFYVDILLLSTSEDFSNSYLGIIFSKTNLYSYNWQNSAGLITCTFNSDYVPLIVDYSGHGACFLSNNFVVSTSTNYASYTSNRYGTLSAITSINLIDNFSNYFLNGEYPFFGCSRSNSDYYGILQQSGSSSYIPAGINYKTYCLPIVLQFPIFTLNRPDYFANFFGTNTYISYISSSNEPFVVIGSPYSTSNFVYTTPTPIPTFEAYPSPTAFPTIAINNNLTPIPEDIDPGIIWEDITTDDVAGNLHGVITTITDFISSAVPRFYSEVLTIFYRRSDWFSFLAIIPGLSLIIFIIGRLRRK